mgnify:CR=1 FL=1
MNLVQLANDLEYVPKEQLAQMSQDPNSNYPPYLVLSEIQRRTANEKAYASAQSQPTSTVAEEVVGEFMQPQGMQAGMPPESAPTDVFSSGMSGMPASAPMQQPMQMASGGPTGYFKGGQGTVPMTSPTLKDKANQAMYGLENMASSYVNPYSGHIRGGLDAVGHMGIGDQVVNPNALNFLHNANNTLDKVVTGTIGALVPGGSTPFRDMLERRRARQSSGQEAYDENVEALSRSDERSDRASGGSTSYFEGGPTDLTDSEYYGGGLRDLNERLRNQSRIDAATTTAQTAVTEGLDAAGQPLMSSQLVNQNLEPDEMEMEMGMASGGLTSYATGNRTSLNQSFESPEIFLKTKKALADRYMDDDGTLDWSQIGTDGLSAGLVASYFTPVGAVRGLGMAGMRALGAINPFSATARTKALQGLGRQTARVFPNTQRTATGQFRSQRDIGAGALGKFTKPLGILGGVGLLQGMEMDDTYIPDNTNTDTELSQADKDFNKQMQANILANQQAQLDQNALDQKKANRMFSPTDLIQLGGTVMGARDMSELGQGIASVAGLSAQRKVNEKQAGLQARYLQAQTEKIEADIASMPLKDALASLKQINLTLKGLNEGAGDATEEQIAQLEMQRQFLQQRISKQQGYDPSMIAGNNKNVIDSYFPNAT